MATPLIMERYGIMDKQGISKLDLKRQNRMQVLRLIQREGNASRIDMAATLELTRAAVTIITNELIEEGILYEMGEQKYAFNERIPKGRKKILLGINANYRFVFGISVEGALTTAGLSTICGDVLDKRTFTSENEYNKETILEFCKSAYKELLKANCLNEAQILGVGAVISDAAAPMFTDGINDFSELEKKLSEDYKLPAACANLAEGVSLAYNRIFRNKKAEEFLFESMSVLNYGSPLRLVSFDGLREIGASQKNERGISDLVINPGGASLEGTPDGSAAAELSEAGMIKKAEKILSSKNTPALYAKTNGKPENITMEAILYAAENGDKKVAKLLTDAEQLLYTLINNLTTILDPALFVLHGFPIADSKKKEFIGGYEKIYGKEAAGRLAFSTLDAKNSFVGGCELVIEKHFFLRGGLGPKL